MTPTGDRWTIGDLAAEALRLEPADRAAFLDRECRGAPQVRREVEALLAADARAGRFLDDPPLGPRLSDYPEIGDRLGAYELVRELGEGGASRVFEGRRVDDEFQHRVAVKVIRPGAGRDDLLRRFRLERQILARFDHPAIARVFDGGTARGGLPYFVMEHVEGRPIDAHCDAQRLGIEDRIRLMLEVCAAVGYAHQRQVVHRDIKPSNILVTAAGEVKLLDFGIAKILAPDVPVDAVETLTWQRLLTPRYASPEQLRGDPVTTATDVYALGLVLFELLAAGPPMVAEGRRLAELSRLREAEQMARASEVARAQGTGEQARQRREAPSRWPRRLAGDLDSILGKALRADPAERYSTVEQFAGDLRRHLAGQPVRARAGTVRYRAVRFVGRHRLGVAVAGLVLALIAAFVVSTIVQAARVEAQRDVAQRQRDAAVQERQRATRLYELILEIFSAADPADAGNREVSARELLDQAMPRIERRLEGDPRTAGVVLARVGDIYRNLGAFATAETYLTRALEAQEALPSAAADRVQTEIYLGVLRHRQARYDEAQETFRRAEEEGVRQLGTGHPLVAVARLRRAEVLHEARRLAGAEALGRQALAVLESSEEHAEEVAAALNVLGRIVGQEGRSEESRRLHERALELRRRQLGPRHNLVAETLSDLAILRSRSGDDEGAAALMEEALDIFREALGERHPSTVTLKTNVAMTLLKVGRPGPAEELARQALTAQESGVGNVLQRAHSRLVLASALLALGRLDPASRHYEASWQECRAAAPQHPMCGFGRLGLARCAREAGDLERARTVAAEILERWRPALPAEHRLLAETEELLASL